MAWRIFVVFLMWMLPCLLLEHMLFLGTEKFPAETEYEDYLNNHGGGSNAYTDVEATNYHFEVQSPFLEGIFLR